MEVRKTGIPAAKRRCSETMRFNPLEIHTKYLFFTGKGGVGKTSVACATAVSLARSGKKVLIVSTDPASNLDDVFETEIGSHPIPIPGVENLFGVNLDPEEAAREYREKVVGPYRSLLPKAAIASMEEQLSGACTVEIAAFDEFAKLLGEQGMKENFDHLVFDTAPTGHTLRLLQLPKAWTGFLQENTRGSSCLGPLAGLGDKKDLYTYTVNALSDPGQTALLLVTRPDSAALLEADRASGELKELGIHNQYLIINGLLQGEREDEIAQSFMKRQEKALEEMPEGFKTLPYRILPLVPFSLTGVDRLDALFHYDGSVPAPQVEVNQVDTSEGIQEYIDRLSKQGKGVILIMGKGGVGKTTLACAIAIGLAEKGCDVHLATTDPAAHLSITLGDYAGYANFTTSRIDPKAELEKYTIEVLEESRGKLDQEGMELLKEDLSSPCTEEIAVFRAFAHLVEESERGFVVLDTAPTGHTLLLIDAAEAYHREVERSSGEVPDAIRKLLPRLRDPEQAHVVIVTLPEATPVYEASRLQEDLRRAGIEPSLWVINQSWQGVATSHPVLRGRGLNEGKWMDRVKELSNDHYALVPWQKEEPVGLEGLKTLFSKSS